MDSVSYAASSLSGLRHALGVALSCGCSLVLAIGCSDDGDGGQNMLPTVSASESGTSADTATSADTGAETDTAGEVEFPAAYRFDCIDIQGLGDGDGDVLQAKVLETTWSADIKNFKLNIILEVVERADATATVGIRSGIGSGPDDQCAEPVSATELISIAYDPATYMWAPVSGTSGVCSEAATGGGPEGGTYDMELGPDDVVYIYAQDDDTTTFNCTPDAGTPDAVPVRAVRTQVSANAAGTKLAGQLTGCILETEAQTLCSCLGECSGDGPDDLQTDGVCAGCPVGGVPLDQLLGNIQPSTRCSDLLGANAYDLLIGFTATKLPNVPALCG